MFDPNFQSEMAGLEQHSKYKTGINHLPRENDTISRNRSTSRLELRLSVTSLVDKTLRRLEISIFLITYYTDYLICIVGTESKQYVHLLFLPTFIPKIPRPPRTYGYKQHKRSLFNLEGLGKMDGYTEAGAK